MLADVNLNQHTFVIDVVIMVIRIVIINLLVDPDELLELLLTIQVTCPVVEHTGLDDLVVERLLVRGLEENFLLDIHRSD